jgi:uncharacterized protein (TIGR02246 family)
MPACRSLPHCLPAIACLAIAIFSVGSARGVNADEAADAEAIGELNERYVRAFNERQAEKVADCFSKDGDYGILTGMILSKRPAIVQGHASFFGNNPKAKLSGKQLQRRFIRPDVVVAHGEWQVENGPEGYPHRGLWDSVVVKVDGRWSYDSIRIYAPVRP